MECRAVTHSTWPPAFCGMCGLTHGLAAAQHHAWMPAEDLRHCLPLDTAMHNASVTGRNTFKRVMSMAPMSFRLWVSRSPTHWAAEAGAAASGQDVVEAKRRAITCRKS